MTELSFDYIVTKAHFMPDGTRIIDEVQVLNTMYDRGQHGGEAEQGEARRLKSARVVQHMSKKGGGHGPRGRPMQHGDHLACLHTALEPMLVTSDTASNGTVKAVQLKCKNCGAQLRDVSA